jgi:NADPH-dependent glutamate synthase beta subunit-like oxidoreductase/ferredoxin
MIKLKIDNIEISVPEKTSVLQAAESAGIEIPSMCFMEGFTNHPSCMICMVKDANSGKLFPSCAIPAVEGMEIITNDSEVREFRKDALELLLSDHVGDCEAPCRIGCPAFMDIPLMNRLIAKNEISHALEVVKEEIALPLILGYICSAPCEKVCRRASIDNPVAICQLKKHVAVEDLKSENPFFPEKEMPSGKKVAIVGSGPSGLACAFHLTKKGHECIVFDKHATAGGSLNNLSEDFLPKEKKELEINYIKKFGVKFKLNTLITEKEINDSLLKDFDAVVMATGHLNYFKNELSIEKLNISKDTFETKQEGLFACGSIIKMQEMAVKAVAQGKLAAKSVDQFLRKAEVKKEKRMFNSKFGKLQNEEFEAYLNESNTANRHIPAKGNLTGFINKEAIAEASRCMHCDCRKPQNCKLRIYSNEYDADRRKYLSGERKQIKKYFNHEKIVFEPEKCIKCGICVEIAKNEKELTGLSFIGRGFNVEVNIPFNKQLNEALAIAAIKCAEYCPTGAISLKTKNDHEKDH